MVKQQLKEHEYCRLTPQVGSIMLSMADTALSGCGIDIIQSEYYIAMDDVR